MYFHSQDLRKEDKHWSLVHWRCWLGQNPEFTFYINFPSSFWMVKVDLCENGWQEEVIGLSISLFGLYLAFGFRWKWLYHKLEQITKRKGQSYTNGRDIGLSIHSGKLWVSLWEDPMESRSTDPWWWHFTIDPMDILFGKQKYTETVLQEGGIDIDMPEGVYKATFKRFVSHWKRPRNPFVQSIHRMEFTIPVGIPHEGKGENSWDMGMDATFGTTFPIKEGANIYEEAKKFAMRMLQERQKYGSLSSTDYTKWKVQGELRLAQKESGQQIIDAAGVPDEMVGSPVNSSASEAKLQKEVHNGEKKLTN